MKLDFRMRIFTYFLIIILFAAIPIGIISYKNVYKIVEYELFANARNQAIQLDNNISNMFEQIKANAKFLANSKEIVKTDESILALFNMQSSDGEKKYSKQIPGLESDIYNVFENYAIAHPEIAYVYLGTKWGGYIQWPDGLDISRKFDPRPRPWYIQASENPNGVSISVPYLATDGTGSTIVSSSTTVKNKFGDDVGVLGIDISLEKLSEIIRNVKVGDTGYVLLYLKDGTIIANPDNSLNFKHISQINDVNYPLDEKDESAKDFQKSYREFIYRDSGNFETIIDGKEVLVTVNTSDYTGWKIASVIPKQEVINKANRVRDLIALIGVLGILFIMILTLLATKKITKPIEELKELMKAAGNGNLTVKSNINTKDEFGELGESFNLMINQLSSNYDELAAVYEELMATEEALRSQYDELQLNEEALKNSEERYKLALECANDSIFEWDLITDDFFVSDKLFEIIGYRLIKPINFIDEIYKLVHPEDIDKVRKNFNDHIENKTDIYKSEYRLKNIEGSYMWVSSRGKALRNSKNEAIKILGSISDISERKLSEEKIKFMAFYDTLTKLPNRTLFMDKLKNELELIESKKSEGAVFFIDLDNFKNINDTMGHDYGDKLLIYIAKKFTNILKEKDTVSRLGGDEFILLKPDFKEHEVEHYSNRLLEMFNEPFEIEDKLIYITASIGVALYPRDGSDITTVFKNADAAMYRAKELGKNRFAIYNPEIYLKLERKINIERILRSAIENNELSIQYQPKYDVKSEKISGFESLIRLNSKELGFISPPEFISIAEETGYITNLTTWIIEGACKQSVKWIKAGYKFNNIAINISSIDLQNREFVQDIKRIIKDTGINPEMIELEITESVLMNSFEVSIEALKKLMEIGIKIALDDFGTGYSSLSYLRKIPINTLKIDKSFIDNITSNTKEEAIITNIIEMAHSMDLEVVAEGVETKDQYSILKNRNCDYIQGYYLSKPLKPEEIENLFEIQ